MPMKLIPGGFCICPAPKLSCELDNKDNADNIYCAYGLCSNQSHLYFNLPYHIKQYQQGIKAIKYNIENDYQREAEKELYKLQYIINSLIIPEIEQFEQTIKAKGCQYVLDKHPDLSDIYKTLTEIKKGVNSWKQMKVKSLSKKIKAQY